MAGSRTGRLCDEKMKERTDEEMCLEGALLEAPPQQLSQHFPHIELCCSTLNPAADRASPCAPQRFLGSNYEAASARQ
jgi:hypothetical protein